VLILGWVGLVHRAIGDVVVIDELVIVSPVVLTIMASWWWFFPVERRLREAVVRRHLHDGTPLAPLPTRAAYVLFWTGQLIMPVLVPVLAITAWSEGIDALLNTQARGSIPAWVTPAAHVLGVLLLVLLLPIALTRLWRAVPMPPSSMRDALLAVCSRNRVRVRDLLVWRTSGSIHNAAVLGVVPSTRYILVTDAMLESFPLELLEGVLAHEVGHVRRRHLIWLGLSTLASLLATSLVFAFGASFAWQWWGVPQNPQAPLDDAPSGELALQVFAGLLSLACCAAIFGWVSRRFEWQADAFAASDLSLAADTPSSVVTPEAAGRLRDALGEVAACNGISPTRFMWRHGSIRDRQRRLTNLIGLSIRDLPIDARVRHIKQGTIFVLAVFVLLWIWIPSLIP
jgi:Zn-dependent protease with chaperone function